jgi:hypothetical protein
LIYYDITENTCLTKISKFVSGVFTELSDHSPLSFCIPLKDYVTQSGPSIVNNCHGRVNARPIEWKNENSEALKECLNNIVPDLQRILDVKFNNIDDLIRYK